MPTSGHIGRVMALVVLTSQPAPKYHTKGCSHSSADSPGAQTLVFAAFEPFHSREFRASIARTPFCAILWRSPNQVLYAEAQRATIRMEERRRQKEEAYAEIHCIATLKGVVAQKDCLLSTLFGSFAPPHPFWCS